MEILTIVIVLSSVLASTLLRYIWTVDAGDLASALQFNQLAHPPGYPLYLIFGGLLKVLVPGASVTYILSLSSAIAAVVASVFLYKIFRLVYRKLFAVESPKYVTVPAVLMVNFIGLWWIYSVTQEVFMWSVMFIVMTLYVALKTIIDLKPSKRFYFLGLVILSFGIFHQYVLLILLPFYLIVYWYRFKVLRPRDLLTVILILPLGFIPYLFYLRTEINPDTPRLWYATATIRDLFYIAFRQNYGSLTLFSALGKAGFADRLTSVWDYCKDMVSLWNILIIPALIGLFVLLKKRPRLGMWLLLLFILFGPGLFFVYPLLLVTPMMHAIFQRFLLYSFPFIGLFVFVGMAYLSRMMMLLAKESKLVLASVILVFMLIPVIFLYKYFDYFRNISTYNGLELYAKAIIDFLPKNSLLVVKNDPFAMPITYVSYVLKYRPDTTVMSSMLVEESSIYKLNKAYFRANSIEIPPEGPDRLNNLLFLTAKKRPVFTNFHVEGFKQFKQAGPLYQVTDKPVPVDINKAVKFYEKAGYITSVSRPVFPLYGIDEIGKYLERSLNYYISYFERKNDYMNTLRFYTILNKIAHSSDTQYAIGVLYYKMGNCQSAYDAWELGFKQFTEPLFAQRLTQLSAACFKDLRKANFWNVIYEFTKKKNAGRK